jgi:uncharacterized protein DUF4258
VTILEDICASLRNQRYRVSDHAADEMLADAVDVRHVLHATLSGEVIEHYPKAFPFPACLVLGWTSGGIPIHAVWAFDPGPCYAILITVYRPDPARWAADLRTRVKR